MKLTWVTIAAALLVWSANTLLANGGAWQTGVPETGNGAASDQKKTTEVTIEEEKLTIDLHQEFAAVEVRYRMRNTGPQVEQDFFFPMERWTAAESETGDSENSKTDLEGYRISADGTELKSANVDAKGVEKPKPLTDEHWGEFSPAKRLWKKSRIPFAKGQTREVVIRYRSGYAGTEGGVSDDSYASDAILQYSLSPAATWKGPIGKGTVTINVLHPRPEEVIVSKPKERFKKINSTRFQWDFRDLKPTLADDIKVIAHPAFKSYWARRDETEETKARSFHASYVVEGNRYFLEHTDYDPVASSTLKPNGERKYDVENIQGYEDKTWAEGVEGDGIGESVTLTARRPLPLDSIRIMPGYQSLENPTLWAKNNRVAGLEVTLNGERTFTVAIPDEKFSKNYPIPVRDYAKPVNTVTLTIKAVHRGTAARDTCISSVELRGKLSEKPEINPAR